MAMLSSRRLLLVSFILLCFISNVRGRSLRETNRPETRDGAQEISKNDLVKNNQGGETPDTDDLVTMDYTPIKKNPPIHN
ncbi:hypothetical protein L6164_012303 [Bauhinia variegata]|uniref:Uncharacterized protein n=1 Tax=Bauhinia variegata TaxID=167791 RepID=A0ACB9P8L0_BAUVA|nr:hypothetical protein L6164_012303 [Bauhinia variegata]